jgi:hypothetical protein
MMILTMVISACSTSIGGEIHTWCISPDLGFNNKFIQEEMRDSCLSKLFDTECYQFKDFQKSVEIVASFKELGLLFEFMLF